jgi:hypothetical protein
MYPSKRVNVQFTEAEYKIDGVISLCEDFDNMFIRVGPDDLKYLQQYEEKEVNYFFDKSLSVYSYCLLEWVLARKTKGIYISDDLTYNLPEVYKQCSSHGIELRIVLNRIPMTAALAFSCPTVQIYRPQDFEFLSEYYSVGEFDCGKEYDWEKSEVLYRRWFITHDWDTDLDFMNHDLQLPFPTRSIPPELTRLRSKCQHRCTLRADNICSKCRRLLLLGYKNADSNLVYKDSQHGLPSFKEISDNIIVSKKDNSK